MCAGKFPLVSMGGLAEGLACADPGARTPIGASGNFEQLTGEKKELFGNANILSSVNDQPLVCEHGDGDDDIRLDHGGRV